MPDRLAAAAVGAFGNLAATRLQADPWLALELPGVRPDAADRFALADAGVIAQAVAGLGYPDPARAITSATDDGRVVDLDEGRLALARYGMAEDAVAEGIVRLLATGRPLAGGREDAARVAEGLDPAQQAAVVAAAELGVSVLTGGPGTGKSRTVAAIVALCEEQGASVELAAPTGRAAKRLTELTGAPASTLHRLLGAQGRSGNFARGRDWPLDADVVVVDEASMLDVELSAALVEACADGTHLILVGDPAQLPSIGPGRVLADVIDSAAVAVTELTTLHRQSVGGAIDRLAAAVRTGELPPVPPPGPQPEVAVMGANDSAAAARRAVSLVTEAVPRALSIPPADIQVVTPVHRGPAGTAELNQALKAILNPGGARAPGRPGFDPGDRVVATANHLDIGFANGEVGTVSAVGDGGGVQVSFGGALLDVPPSALADLSLGWAITVHRAQGSEWPAVVAVLPPEGGGLLSRPLVYTAFTRAERHLSVVHACGPALARAVRLVGARPRRTRLAGLLRAAGPGAGGSAAE